MIDQRSPSWIAGLPAGENAALCVQLRGTVPEIVPVPVALRLIAEAIENVGSAAASVT